MENLKILVASEADSKEAQELLDILGYSKDAFENKSTPCWIAICDGFTYSDYNIGKSVWYTACPKKITLQELRDLVVLKRNDATDCTHWHVTGQANLPYLFAMDEWYFFGRNGWEKSTHTHEFYNRLKPIEKPMKEYLHKNNDGEYILEVTNEREAQEPHAKHWIEVPKGCDYLISVFGVNSFIDSDMFAKFKTKNVLWSRKPMKEYLIKSGDGKYLLTHHDSIGAIEIPEGCNIITCENRKGNIVYFHWKSLDSDEFFLKDEKIWSNNFNETLSDFVKKNEGDVKIIWSRYTHPEELPFIDDEPSLNDQYAEIEQFRKQTIEATLAERQAQYGCFEDVARTTGKIMEALSEVRVNGLNDLPHTHRMALYMIASKMARIVNGDFNHKDSWHDIGGYSKLIENLL